MIDSNSSDRSQISSFPAYCDRHEEWPPPEFNTKRPEKYQELNGLFRMISKSPLSFQKFFHTGRSNLPEFPPLPPQPWFAISVDSKFH